MDTAFFLNALKEYRERTGDERSVDSLPTSEFRKLLIRAQELKDASKPSDLLGSDVAPR
jgi:hypothetical protein